MISDTWADSTTPVTLELYYQGDWHDITDDLTDDGVTIKRGRDTWDGAPSPSELTCTLTGDWAPSAPGWAPSVLTTPTPLRFTATLNGTDYQRFTGSVSEWPQAWTEVGTRYQTITASGALRSLSLGVPPSPTAMDAEISTLGSLLEHWPMTDPDGSAVLHSNIPGGSPAVWSGSPSLATATDDWPAGSDAGVTLNKTSGWLSCIDPLYARVRTHDTATAYEISALVRIPYDATLSGVVFPLYGTFTGGDVHRAYVGVHTTTGAMTVNLDLTNGTYTSSVGFTSHSILDEPVVLGFHVYQNGSNISYRLWRSLHDDDKYTHWTWTGSFASHTLGKLTDTGIMHPGYPGLSDGTEVAHLTVRTVNDTTWAAIADEALYAHVGETAEGRVSRLASSVGITVTTDETGQPMGDQLSGSIIDLVSGAVASDMGSLQEDRTADQLNYLSSADIIGKASSLDLTWESGFLDMTPTWDDRATHTQTTVTRTGGSSSVIGDDVSYPQSIDLSLYKDVQTRDQAGWRTYLGDQRTQFKTVTIDLAHPTLRADRGLSADVIGVDIGDRITVTGLPIPVIRDADLLVCGVSETITPSRWTITWACDPFEPWRGSVWDADRWSGAGTVLAGGISATDTSVAVTPPSGVSWTHADGDYQVTIDHEVVTVTGVAGDTLTVTRGAHATTHDAGAPVEVYPVPHYWIGTTS